MLMLTEFGVKTVQSLTYFWKIQNDKKKTKSNKSYTKPEQPYENIDCRLKFARASPLVSSFGTSAVDVD